ncbi:hypothetical protein [Noviherbaspirillum massiliense]|uniref:hypothetical protein n=1 Tax=Noviherbaspirillum massiliense TaxID=1465823 RepID=UPI0002D796CD|nr:hypothetical protein [Noviherbaspirillum massiliense]
MKRFISQPLTYHTVPGMPTVESGQLTDISDNDKGTVDETNMIESDVAVEK